ncbi:MAG: BNR-4 repeat-containing protein [Phycisphaerae bacterium]|jgi:hypothetical protein
MPYQPGRASDARSPRPFIWWFLVPVLSAAPALAVPPNSKLDGYRGIWFSIGQANAWGPKYSGGLGTYTANHVPIAVYAPAVDKTFFVYGGVDEATGDLLIMASWYDHATCTVPRPTVVYHKVGVNDPHDNAALLIDRDGRLWVFISGRGSARPGFIYKSTAPYSTDEFVHVLTDERTYPQPWYLDDGSNPPRFVHLFTKYTAGRELYWATSADGATWSPHQKMAGFGGHYQTSMERNGKIGTAFNYHPGGDVDKRTNLYYMQTTDGGQTWTTADGTPLTTPLNTVANPARLVDYQAQGLLCYINDTNFDEQGNPYIVYITSKNYAAGPGGDPRVWRLARWTGQQWVFSEITTGDHNYDVGNFCLEGNILRLFGPTGEGPQAYGTGGEVRLWLSYDFGATWTKVRDVTTHSQYNHSYVRRPRHARDPFYAYWADGNPLVRTESRLYFCNRAGTRVWRLPERMTTDFARPERVRDFGGGGAPLWRSRFEVASDQPVVHGQQAVAVVNAVGGSGTAVGAVPLTYAAYGQSGVGSAPVAGAGQFALSFPDHRTLAIDTNLPSDADGLAQAVTLEGFFRTPQTAPITSPSNVGRRLVTQKRPDGEGSSRLAVGLHAKGSVNVLAVYWRSLTSVDHLELGTTTVQANTWYHFAVTYDGTAIRWYLGGVLQGTVANPNIVGPGPFDVAIGNNRINGENDRGFYGLIDQVRISNRALSPDEFLLNGGSCQLACGAGGGSTLWCSGFETVAGGAVAHGQTASQTCGAIHNQHGTGGTPGGAAPLAYAVYGQPGVGPAPSSAAGNAAIRFGDDRSQFIDTNLPSNAGQLAAALTFEGFFNHHEAAPILSPDRVGRRLVTQKRGSDAEARLAIGLHANGGANVLAVYRRGADGADQVALGGSAIQPGTWHHFALVLNAGVLTWYLDGQPQGQVPAGDLDAPGAAPIIIGNERSDGSADRGFYGLIDEVRIVDRALSPGEFLSAAGRLADEPCHPACNDPFADADGDGDVDQFDFGRLQTCLTGGGMMGPGADADCLCFDRDADGAIGGGDLGAFIECVTGPGIPWDPRRAGRCVP